MEQADLPRWTWSWIRRFKDEELIAAALVLIAVALVLTWLRRCCKTGPLAWLQSLLLHSWLLVCAACSYAYGMHIREINSRGALEGMKIGMDKISLVIVFALFLPLVLVVVSVLPLLRNKLLRACTAAAGAGVVHFARYYDGPLGAALMVIGISGVSVALAYSLLGSWIGRISTVAISLAAMRCGSYLAGHVLGVRYAYYSKAEASPLLTGIVLLELAGPCVLALAILSFPVAFLQVLLRACRRAPAKTIAATTAFAVAVAAIVMGSIGTTSVASPTEGKSWEELVKMAQEMKE
eukprot:gnl/TRDRNA2_/TRDRNA2_89025_c0_seq1.p1 gnl/TRDRNA2_/TRDRNA2_89025_c0~~gnl/TRDRNA2_/TRDRNA2_89025_c0_seq1.p1  ORF type:complete len:294 (+),score=38.42 gnl/TRDRNA2_/TRDRNA2_89025_c0_seq1:83-964(+)